jgi:hypothetical protein
VLPVGITAVDSVTPTIQTKRVMEVLEKWMETWRRGAGVHFADASNLSVGSAIRPIGPLCYRGEMDVSHNQVAIHLECRGESPLCL